MAIDTLIIGYNDGVFADEVKMLRSMRKEHPNYRDLNLNFIEYQGQPYRAMDILDHFYYEGRTAPSARRFHNADVLWMVIMYLGTYLSKRGCTFDYVNLFQLQKDELKEKLLANDYLTTVVTTTIYNYDTPITEVVDFVRTYNPKTKIIVGGPYIAKRAETMTPADLQNMFKYIGADVYVRSREGEQALVSIVKALRDRRTLKAIPNLAYEEDGRFVFTHNQREINTLYDNLIDYSLFPKEHVGSYVNVRITKGCPFACAFCSFPLRTEKYNVSRLDYIERELNAIRDVGTVSGIFFVDDTLNVPLDTFKDMLRMMIRQRYGFKWHCFFRADFCDQELVDLMAASGCQGVFLGLESANDDMLKAMNKTPRKQHYLQVVPMFRAAGIKVFASLFFGFPGETEATARETIEFLEETRPEFYRPLVWYCDPVTPIWSEKDKYGLKGYHFGWSHNTMNVAEACDLVEKCFITFDQPVWVPDPGFNFVSLFLLQDRGMSLDQVTTFLKSFNAVVKEKVFDPDRLEPSPHLIENLRRACQYDRPDRAGAEVIDVLSGERYDRAEQFWVREIGETAPAGRGAAATAPTIAVPWRAAPVHTVPAAVVETIARGCDADLATVLLTAYAITLWRIGGRGEALMVAALEHEDVFPVRVTSSASLSFGDVARHTAARLAASAAHRPFVRRLLTHGLRLPGQPRLSPSLPAALWECAVLPTGAVAAPDIVTRFAQDAYGGLELILAVSRTADAVAFRLLYSAERFEPDQVEHQAGALLTILTSAAAAPNTPIGDIALADYADVVRDASIDRQESVQFAF